MDYEEELGDQDRNLRYAFDADNLRVLQAYCSWIA
jgi:hypothetical protein